MPTPAAAGIKGTCGPRARALRAAALSQEGVQGEGVEAWEPSRGPARQRLQGQRQAAVFSLPICPRSQSGDQVGVGLSPLSRSL